MHLSAFCERESAPARKGGREGGTKQERKIDRDRETERKESLGE